MTKSPRKNILVGAGIQPLTFQTPNASFFQKLQNTINVWFLSVTFYVTLLQWFSTGVPRNPLVCCENTYKCHKNILSLITNKNLACFSKILYIYLVCLEIFLFSEISKKCDNKCLLTQNFFSSACFNLNIQIIYVNAIQR